MPRVPFLPTVGSRHGPRLVPSRAVAAASAAAFAAHRWIDALQRSLDPEVFGISVLPHPSMLDGAGDRCACCSALLERDPHGDTVACALPQGIDAMIALGEYAGRAGEAARMIKGACWSDGAWSWGSALGRALGAEHERLHAPASTPGQGAPPGHALVPVPGDPWRTAWRGLDHAGRIARAASAASCMPCVSLLVRRDATRQASRGARARRSAQGRFAIKLKSESVPESVWLVDDVCTTGATATDCATQLRAAGASWVGLAVLARAHR